MSMDPSHRETSKITLCAVKGESMRPPVLLSDLPVCWISQGEPTTSKPPVVRAAKGYSGDKETGCQGS